MLVPALRKAGFETVVLAKVRETLTLDENVSLSSVSTPIHSSIRVQIKHCRHQTDPVMAWWTRPVSLLSCTNWSRKPTTIWRPTLSLKLQTKTKTPEPERTTWPGIFVCVVPGFLRSRCSSSYRTNGQQDFSEYL